MIMHTAITLDATMNTLASIDASMQVLAQFKALETPEMKGLKTYVKTKGVEEFLVNDQALEELEIMTRLANPVAIPGVVVGEGSGPRVRSSSHRSDGYGASSRHRNHSYSSSYHMGAGSAYPTYSGGAYQTSGIVYVPSSSHYGYNSGYQTEGVMGGSGPRALEVIRKQLSEDLKDSLDRNMVVFLRKLDVQKRMIEELGDRMRRESDRVITAVISGPHGRIVDPVSSLFVSFLFD
jgi:hypothetical protein